MSRIAFLPIVAAVLAAAAPAFGESERVYKDAKGRIRCTPIAIPAADTNPWPAEMEEGFWDRANVAIKNHAGKGYGNTYFENEKRSYPLAMMDFLAGNRKKALDWLQGDDDAGYNKYTNMVDFYPAFTLKGQMRKFYFFGEFLTPEYKEKFVSGAKVWTATDPRTRKHPLVERTKPGQGWAPDATGVSVDTRNTDNLQAMRETAVYLMAELTGNTATRDEYAAKLITNVKNMYRVGMGEWDSNNYLGHTMTGYIQLHDFARDEKMRRVGKAAMDYICATGALKYYRGGYGGPSKRDYNHPVVHGGSAADHLGLYYGDYPGEDHEASYDNVHFITSAYRPPMAAVEVARKAFKKPAEVLVTHASYNALRGGADKPAYYETNFTAHSYNLATLSTGTDGPGGDTNGFKLVADNSKRGVDFFMANTTSDPAYIGSAKYAKDNVHGGNNVAQHRNLCIWLSATPDVPFIFMLPKSARIESQGGITFVALEKTWLALHPVNLKVNGVDAALTEKTNFNTSVDRKTGKETKSPRWPDEQVISASGTGKFSGFALEVGEKESHGDFAAFKKAVIEKARLDASVIGEGTVAYTSATGESLKIKYNAAQPEVARNGKPHDWASHKGLYQPVDGSNSPIRLDWGSGKLHVEGNTQTFTAEFRDDGTYTFTNTAK